VAAFFQEPGQKEAQEGKEEEEEGPGAHRLGPVEGEKAHGHQVLQDEDADGQPPVVGGELPFVLQELEDHDGAGEAQGQGQREKPHEGQG
jgi:hypothetical protein